MSMNDAIRNYSSIEFACFYFLCMLVFRQLKECVLISDIIRKGLTDYVRVLSYHYVMSMKRFRNLNDRDFFYFFALLMFALSFFFK